MLNFSMGPEQPLMPERLIFAREPWYAPKSGKRIDIIAVYLNELSGVRITTHAITRHVFPPLDDGTTPMSTSEIRECSYCLRIISEFNTITCPSCGHIFCLPCTTIGLFENQKLRICKDCNLKLNGTFVDYINRWIEKIEQKKLR